MSGVDEYVLSFNETLIDFLLNLSKIIPNSLIGKNIVDIEKAIREKGNRYKFIDVFVAKVLKYKSQIDDGNEDFFMEQSFNDDTEGDSSMVNRIFEFKDLWKKLDENNKKVVIQYLQVLCELAQEYFIIIDN